MTDIIPVLHRAFPAWGFSVRDGVWRASGRVFVAATSLELLLAWITVIEVPPAPEAAAERPEMLNDLSGLSAHVRCRRH